MALFSFDRNRRLLFAFLRDRWRAAVIVFLLDFLSNFCVIGISLLLAQVAATAFGFRSLRGNLLGLPPAESGILLTWFGCVIAVKFLSDYVRYRLRGYLAEDFAHWLRTLAFERHLDADLRWHENRDSGKSLLRFSGDLGSAQRLLTRGIFQYAADLALLLMGLGFIAWFDGRLTLFLGGLVVLGWYLIHLINLRLRNTEARRRAKKAGLLAFVNTVLLRLPGILALNHGRRMARRFGRKAEKVRILGRQYHRMAAFSDAFPSFFVQLLLLVVLGIGWKFGLPADVLFAIVLVLMSWRSPLARLLQAGLIWKKGLLSLEKINGLLRSPATTEGALVFEKKRAHSLCLREVTLLLGDKTIFKNLSFRLSVGETVCLPLGTGCGKTALVKLLAGLYRPESGVVEWDGVAAEKFNMRSLRRQIAFVSDAFPLNGFSLPDALSNSNQATALARAESELRRWQILFPALQNLDFYQKITEQTPMLSTGQQRILQCLRAVLSDKPFLVLDEPFAGLDNGTAKTLDEVLGQYRGEKAILLLSARLTTGNEFESLLVT